MVKHGGFRVRLAREAQCLKRMPVKTRVHQHRVRGERLDLCHKFTVTCVPTWDGQTTIHQGAARQTPNIHPLVCYFMFRGIIDARCDDLHLKPSLCKHRRDVGREILDPAGVG